MSDVCQAYRTSIAICIYSWQGRVAWQSGLNLHVREGDAGVVAGRVAGRDAVETLPFAPDAEAERKREHCIRGGWNDEESL